MKHAFWALRIVTLILAAGLLRGQEAENGTTLAPDLPDAPSTAISNNRAAAVVDLGHSVDAATHRDRASCGPVEPCDRGVDFSEKLRYFRDHTLGPGAFFSPIFTAAPEMAKPPARYPKEWRQGAAAFGRLYGDALAFQTAAQTGRFLAGAAFHEDPRYLRSSSSNPLMRTMHAIVFTAFDKSDSGHTTFALSNFAGAASAGFVGNAYLPSGYNDTSHALTRTGIAFGSFAFTNLAIEFSPEGRRVARALHLPKFLVG